MFNVLRHMVYCCAIRLRRCRPSCELVCLDLKALTFWRSLRYLIDTFIDRTIWKDNDSSLIFCFSFFEVANVVTAVGVDGSAFSVRESCHPVALIVSVFSVNVVCIDMGFLLMEFKRFNSIWIRTGLHLFVRVYSTAWRSLGLSRLTA